MPSQTPAFKRQITKKKCTSKEFEASRPILNASRCSVFLTWQKTIFQIYYKEGLKKNPRHRLCQALCLKLERHGVEMGAGGHSSVHLCLLLVPYVSIKTHELQPAQTSVSQQYTPHKWPCLLWGRSEPPKVPQRDLWGGSKGNGLVSLAIYPQPNAGSRRTPLKATL